MPPGSRVRPGSRSTTGRGDLARPCSWWYGSAAQALPGTRTARQRTGGEQGMGLVAQPVEHPPCKRDVVGSTPTGSTEQKSAPRLVGLRSVSRGQDVPGGHPGRMHRREPNTAPGRTGERGQEIPARSAKTPQGRSPWRVTPRASRPGLYPGLDVVEPCASPAPFGVAATRADAHLRRTRDPGHLASRSPAPVRSGTRGAKVRMPAEGPADGPRAQGGAARVQAPRGGTPRFAGT